MNNENGNKSILKKILLLIGLIVIAIILWAIMPKRSADIETVAPVEETETGLPGEGETSTDATNPSKTPVKPGVTGGIIPTPTPVVNGKIFKDDRFGVSLSYPKDFVVATEVENNDLPWRYNSAFPGTRLFTLTLPKSFQPNTNFSDAKVTVGISMDPTGVNGCLQAENGEINRSSGTTFSRFTLGGAGAGNYYETTSYRTLKNGACLSIETVIHSTAIANYPASSGIKEFNKTSVQQKLNQVINSVNLI